MSFLYLNYSSLAHQFQTLSTAAFLASYTYVMILVTITDFNDLSMTTLILDCYKFILENINIITILFKFLNLDLKLVWGILCNFYFIYNI